jgi:hypothetical protein
LPSRNEKAPRPFEYAGSTRVVAAWCPTAPCSSPSPPPPAGVHNSDGSDLPLMGCDEAGAGRNSAPRPLLCLHRFNRKTQSIMSLSPRRHL